MRGRNQVKLNAALRLLRGYLITAASLAFATAAEAQPAPAGSCSIHVYPADGVHSVGEDFDAVHQVDQDLRHYYQTAGRALDWLTPKRQLELVDGMPLGGLVGVTTGANILHSEPVTRRQALQPGPREAASGCVIEILVPQIMLERGGLATRSLRLFGVIRRYENGALIGAYSGFASAPMTGFQLKGPADAPAATALVEQAYRSAVETMLRNSTKSPRK